MLSKFWSINMMTNLRSPLVAFDNLGFFFKLNYEFGKPISSSNDLVSLNNTAYFSSYSVVLSKLSISTSKLTLLSILIPTIINKKEQPLWLLLGFFVIFRINRFSCELLTIAIFVFRVITT